jgi:predicted transcriptional regulator
MRKRMKVKRNLTRYHCTPLTVRNNRIWQNYKRKIKRNWINNEFD